MQPPTMRLDAALPWWRIPAGPAYTRPVMSAAFDTLSVARDLEAAGIARAHAEAIAQVVHHGDERAATKADLDQLRAALEGRTDTRLAELRAATKADLDQLRTTTKADLDQLRAATKADLDQLRTALEGRTDTRLAELRADLYRALWIQGGAIVAILTALRFLPA